MIDKTLEKLGLKDEEIKTFLYLLENGEQTAGALAKKTGLSRPSLYGFLKKLKESGLVVESQKNAEGAELVDIPAHLAARSFDPALLQTRNPVEYRPARNVVDAVGDEVAVAFELQLVVRLRMRQ